MCVAISVLICVDIWCRNTVSLKVDYTLPHTITYEDINNTRIQILPYTYIYSYSFFMCVILHHIQAARFIIIRGIHS